MALMIPGRSVQLEAILREPETQTPRASAVLCHPHPVYGGTMNNRVVYRAAKAVREAGLVALRFNFRGVGASTGSFDQGEGEKDDVVAAIDHLEKNYPSLPMALVGFSFGARVGLQVGYRDSRIEAMVGLGVPLGLHDFDYLAENHKPTLYIVGALDQYCPREKMDSLARRFPTTSKLIWIEGADHFFNPGIEQVQALITEFFRGLPFSRSSE
jgi:uncharacterized protein